MAILKWDVLMKSSTKSSLFLFSNICHFYKLIIANIIRSVHFFKKKMESLVNLMVFELNNLNIHS